MHSQKLIVMVLLVARVVPCFGAEVDGRIRDAAARIDYGWLTEDLGLIVAARDSLEGRATDPWASYLKAYAAFRAAQLLQASGQGAEAFVDDCEASAEAMAASEVEAEVEVEASILIAACAAMAAAEQPLRAVLHQRRMRQAMARAAMLEPDNLRLLLVAFYYANDVEDLERPAPDVLLAAVLAQRGDYAYPDWGEAEALTALGSLRLDAGDFLGARDLLEQALLIAPDFQTALELEGRIRRLSENE